jgi:outer membrane receptor protein involved in Fe transport
MRVRRIPLLVMLVLHWPALADGQERASDRPEEVLPPVVVTAPPPVASSSEVLIPRRDFELRPQGRPADLVRLVPGLVIGQHQGGGKAEQYFLRGFDSDHGTDVALFVDGMPVNLRSHAHGQGYADLHFLIPETVARIDAFKGPYFAELGDFATAGAVNFVTLDTVPEGLVEAAYGTFNTQRYLTLLSPTRDSLKTLIALEGYFTDGPFRRDQNYRRFNAFAKASATLTETVDVSLWASHLRSDWFASGQVPSRAVRADLIDRFGAIDNSEGGDTQRTSVNGTLRWRPSETHLVTVQTYAQYYALNLFSNFTFFLNDPDNGDGIEQFDRRVVAGLDARYEHRAKAFGFDLTSTAGAQYRIDTPRVILARQVDRQRLERTQDVNIVEQSYSPFVRFDVIPLQWLRLVTGARGDIFHYDVKDNLDGAGGRLTGNETRAVPSVKANLILGPWLNTEFFANFGTGFHSNDARAVILDPRLDALARAQGYEAGVKTRPHPRVELSATYWRLDLDSELVFVGDEGTTEPRGPSRRVGGELATRVRLLDWLTFSCDVTVTRAEFENGDAVPLAPRLTARADLTARLPWGLATSIGMRHLGDRFATEDREQKARGYTLFDFVARYRYRALEAFVSMENIFDQKYREAQFFFTSRLLGEPAEGVDDIHFTPGTRGPCSAAWPSDSNPQMRSPAGGARALGQEREESNGDEHGAASLWNA